MAPARPAVTMNGAPQDAAEPTPVWERPWSLEEIRKGSQSWSLASDAGLLRFLQEFSQQTISRTHEIKKQVDGLISETKATDCRLHNVFNDFLMLSNTQFIENRVYDEEVEEPIPKADVGDKTEQEKTREQKEADLIPKIQEAVNYGLQVLDSAFEQLDIKAGNSDSEEEESNERVELILEPKDLYIDRPLPYLIGSQQFMEQDDVGLGDLSSEEGSVDSDRGSVIDSEEKDEEESDDEFGNPSEDDQKTRTAQMSDEDDYEACDLFDSEKEEDEDGDLDESTRPKKKRPTSFADELAARIKGEVPAKQGEECSSLPSETKTRKTLKEKKEVRVPSDDEDDIFKPPKLTDEDFTPFGSRGGLFSGGTGLFDDEESDLFAEAPKGEESKEREEQDPISEGGSDVFSSTVIVEKDKKSAAQSTEKTLKQPGKVVLFDDDDDDFFVGATKKPPDSVKSTADLFDDDEEGDLFKEKPAISPVFAGTTKETESHREAVMEQKSQPSSGEDFKTLSETPPRKQKSLFSDEEDSEDLFSSSKTVKSKATSLPTSKSMTKTSLSLFDDDEEDLFGVVPVKKQQEKPLEEKAKQSESLKKASSLLFSSDEEEHWNVSKPAKLPSEDDQKEDPAKPASTVSQAKTVKKMSLFEEEDEEDLFAITKESQRKPQKASLLFEDDAINEESLFSSQSTLPSAAKAAVQKVKPVRAPPFFNEEEKEEKEDLPDGAAKSKQVEDTLWCLEEPGAVPVPRGTDVAGQQTKEKPFAATSSEPASSSDLFATSPPALEKDVKTQARKVLSLFEEEEEGLEDDDGIKNAQKEIGVVSEKSTQPKSTGVFQDEELLFSHKLQKDNDPDVDLFASTKKSMTANRIMKPSSGGGLFGDDDEDDLFSTTKTNLLKTAEKETFKSSTGPSSDNGNLLENALCAKQDEALKAVTTEANLAINPAALLPGAMPKVSNVKSPLPVLDTPLHEPKDVQNSETFSAAGNNEELGVSFDQPMQADTLHSTNKTRIKVTGKRRPPSRMARRLAAQESQESEEVDSAKESKFSLPKQMSAVVNREEPLATEAESKENGFLSGLSLPAHASVLSAGTNKLLPPESTDQGDDLFESENLFASSSSSRPAAQSKLKERLSDSVANKPIKGREKKPDLSVLGDQDSDDLFQPAQQKSSTKSSPIPFLEDEDDSLFTCQKTGKKELKSAIQQAADPTADIFEDDIFATEAIKPMNKAKEKIPETNLFDDNIDIFADLTIKPKEKKTKKKVEQKSIFDDDMDDIFSSSQVKIPTPKSRSSPAASEAKSESKTLSTFDDPLNAFGGQ
ncbi:WASH complex subunit FAM21C isoform C [Patagioenas fasciata monilis]|uniref:WASH complex subunit FAM21C isoform C n=1 Tax=Patagioenas fasciata monilis TaxID=372326 RepID=A0A1V4KJ18_PATFA|nr:WASH complex subunit FAM21C isoform C [Patagioenas fasciata monilis]